MMDLRGSGWRWGVAVEPGAGAAAEAVALGRRSAAAAPVVPAAAAPAAGGRQTAGLGSPRQGSRSASPAAIRSHDRSVLDYRFELHLKHKTRR